MAGELARRVLRASPLIQAAVHPQHLAGDGIERDAVTAGTRGQEQAPLHQQRRRLRTDIPCGRRARRS